MCRGGVRNTKLQYERIRKTLGRHKNVQYKNVPRSIVDIQNEFKKPEILNKYGVNFDGDEKFYVGTVVTPNHAFTVFASQFAIDFIQNNIAPTSRRYLLDGTFGSLPNQFYQLLTITIEYMNNVSCYLIIFSVQTDLNILARTYGCKRKHIFHCKRWTFKNQTN